MKVLMSWHAAVEPAYRKLFECISDNAQLKVVLPAEWTEGGRRQKPSFDGKENYGITVLETVFTDHIRSFFYPNILKISKEINEFKPDIINVMEEPYSLAAGQFLKLKRLFAPRAKTVLYSAENIDEPQVFPFSRVEASNLSDADAIFVVPEEAVQLWRRRGFKKSISKIPLGIDTGLFKRRADIKDFKGHAKPGDGAFTIGYAGRLMKEKAIESVIDALLILDGKKMRSELFIVGSGAHKTELVRYVKEKGLGERVRFIEAVSQSELPSFYSFIDVLVLPTVTQGNVKEQFGRVLVEAMACQTPVIGSTSGEIPSVIGDAGLIFDEGDSGKLAVCIARLIGSAGLRGELGQKGYVKAVNEYSWESVASKYLKGYNAILSGAGKYN